MLILKSNFCIDKVIFLGFVISAKGIEVDEEKGKAKSGRHLRG